LRVLPCHGVNLTGSGGASLNKAGPRIRRAEPTMNYIFLAIAIISEVIGTTFMKQSEGFTKLVPSLVTTLICPLQSGPKFLLFWIMKEFGNGEEAQAGRDHRQAARS
jgi:hypothetical protein